MKNDATALIRIQNVEIEEIMVGNNRFSDDVWDLSDYVSNRTIARCFKTVRFSYIKNENIKMVVKQYAYYKLGKIRPRTVSQYVTNLSTFIQYCEAHNVDSLRELNFELLMDYLQWIKKEKGFKEVTRYAILTIIS